MIFVPIHGTVSANRRDEVEKLGVVDVTVMGSQDHQRPRPTTPISAIYTLYIPMEYALAAPPTLSVTSHDFCSTQS